MAQEVVVFVKSDYSTLMKCCGGVDEVSVRDACMHASSPSIDVLHPAFTTSFKGKSDDRITLGQCILHQGCVWFVYEPSLDPHKSISSDLANQYVMHEERFLHYLLTADEFLNDCIGFSIHGYRAACNQLYTIWEPIMEGEAILALYFQAKSLKDHNFLDYLKLRNPLHVWVAAKLLQIRDLLRLLLERREEIVLEVKRTYEDINSVFRALHAFCYQSLFSAPVGGLKLYIRKYALAHGDVISDPVDAIPKLIDELRYMLKAPPMEVATLLRFLFADPFFNDCRIATRALFFLDNVATLLNAEDNDTKKENMRALLSRFDAPILLNVNVKDSRVTFHDPVVSWLMGTRDGRGVPLVCHFIYKWPFYPSIMKTRNDAVKHTEDPRLSGIQAIIDSTKAAGDYVKHLETLPGIEGFYFFHAYRTFYSRLEYAKAFFSRIFRTSPSKRYGDILAKASLGLINHVIKSVQDIRSAYLDSNIDEYFEAIKDMNFVYNNVSWYFRETFENLYTEVSRNALQLLQEFDPNKVKDELKSLMVGVVTDYKFVDALLNQQIIPLLRETWRIENNFSIEPSLSWGTGPTHPILNPKKHARMF